MQPIGVDIMDEDKGCGLRVKRRMEYGIVLYNTIGCRYLGTIGDRGSRIEVAVMDRREIWNIGRVGTFVPFIQAHSVWRLGCIMRFDCSKVASSIV